MIKKVVFGIIGLLILIIVVAAIAGGGSQRQTATQPSPIVAQQAQFVFDIPSLIGKSLDEVKATLSSYQRKTLEPTEEQIKLGVKEWEVEFDKDGKELLITYEIKTKRIIDFFISTDDLTGKTQDKEKLLKLGNLREGESGYKIEFVKVLIEPSYFTGVKVIPQ